MVVSMTVGGLRRRSRASLSAWSASRYFLYMMIARRMKNAARIDKMVRTALSRGVRWWSMGADRGWECILKYTKFSDGYCLGQLQERRCMSWSLYLAGVEMKVAVMRQSTACSVKRTSSLCASRVSGWYDKTRCAVLGSGKFWAKFYVSA